LNYVRHLRSGKGHLSRFVKSGDVEQRKIGLEDGFLLIRRYDGLEAGTLGDRLVERDRTL